MNPQRNMPEILQKKMTFESGTLKKPARSKKTLQAYVV